MERTRLRRHPELASCDTEDMDEILQESLLCHVAFLDDGLPVVIPSTFGRIDDQLYLHGSPLSRMMGVIASGAPVSVAVSLLDGLVLATSAFDHSMNYRSLVVFGTGRSVTDSKEKRAALDSIVDHLVPGRRPLLRPMTDKEINATMVVAIPLTEHSVKLRTGPPGRSEEWPVWTGVIPIHTVAGDPIQAVSDRDGGSTPPLPDQVAEVVRSLNEENTSAS